MTQNKTSQPSADTIRLASLFSDGKHEMLRHAGWPEACAYIDVQAAEIERLRAALERLRDCDWNITPADRMDAVRAIARAALDGSDERPHP